MRKPERSWGLFLDRDGVINERVINGYVTSWADFKFLPGVLEAMNIFSSIFSTIIIVTNQQGIGKSLFTENDLAYIHRQMIEQIRKAGGRIDRIYHCSSLKTKNDPNRKPAIGMGLQAKLDFPSIDFSQSYMVGDSQSDMLFGRNLGMETIFIRNENKSSDLDMDMIDLQFPSLIDFAKSMRNSRN